MTVAGATFAALLSWFLLLSPFRLRTRALGLAALAALAGLLLATFRIEGTSGNLVPILVPRWTRAADAPADRVETGPSAPAPEAVAAANFPQFLGPQRDGAVAGVRLSHDWTSRPPRALWRRGVGAAWSGFAVAGRRAVTQEQHGPAEAVVCYDAATGRPLWRHADPVRYETTLAGIGPRATPAIRGGRVVALGATGILNCLDLETGARRWSVDIARDAGASPPQWGYAGSPLVEDGRVIVQAGGSGASLAAYDLSTGARAWAAGSDRPAYASPTTAMLAGRRQIVMVNYDSCTGHDLATGAVLWRYAWRGPQPKAAQPVLIGGDRVVISAGYGVGADAFRVAESGGVWRAEPLWTSPSLKAKFANFVHRDGHLFGLDDGVLACVNAETGERAWRAGRYGHGQLLLVEDLLLVSTESGAVVLVEAVPSEFRELASWQVFQDKTWNSPALAGPLLLVRNDREAACLELPLRN